MKIGVLAFQGAVLEHLKMLENCEVRAFPIKYLKELSEIDGIIIPGGESTTIGKLMKIYHFNEALKDLASLNFPIWGTCAGLILLSKKVVNSSLNDPELLELMNISVKRNAFGRQNESFEEDLEIEGFFGGKFPCVFIRAPYICDVGEKVKILATYEGKIVAAREKNFLACAFHPELTQDTRFHQYFIEIVKNAKYLTKS